jgi:hypothetical protein
MLSTTAPQPATTPIPVQRSAPEFEALLVPHLSMPKRGPQCTLGYHRVFYFILWVLYTGIPWQCLPIPQDAQGKPAMHATTIYKGFANWADDGSLWQASRVCGIWRQRRLATSACGMVTGPTPWPKRGDGRGYSGYQHQQGEHVIAITDTNGAVVTPSLWLPAMPRIWGCSPRG